MSEPTYCEVCGEVNVWHLFGDEYGHVCKSCVEVGDDVGYDDEAEVWRKVERCPGCGATGVVNYGSEGQQFFYCGGSDRCCP